MGTTIFTVMSQMATEHQAINLSQGFPDFSIDDNLLEKVQHYHLEGYHQYAPMIGIAPLRKAIGHIYEQHYQSKYDIDSEILITNGASEAIFSSIAAIIQPGDEVITFEPAYDLYAPTVQLFGGIVKPIQTFAPDFCINWDEVRATVSDQTKLLIINNPNNPTGKMWQKNDFLQLEKLVEQYPQLILIADEVYGWISLNDTPFYSVAQFENLKERSIITVSFGKLLHATGWKIGYCVAPSVIMKEIRKVHQFNVFTVNHALQHAIADYIQDSATYTQLGEFFLPKYNYLSNELIKLGFEVLPSDGTYFLTAGFSKISNKSDVDFSKYLVEQYKVATIPISAFYNNQHDDQLIRFCFAKKDETLQQAVANLQAIR